MRPTPLAFGSTRTGRSSPSSSHQAAEIRKLNATVKESRSEVNNLREELLSDLRSEVRSVVRTELAVASASMHGALDAPSSPLGAATGQVVADGAISEASKPPYAVQSVASDATPNVVSATFERLSDPQDRRRSGKAMPRELWLARDT